VNVVGTVNVLEAVRRRGPGMAPVVYASSIAAYDADESATAGVPGTLYGVFKRANEGTAEIYWRDWGIASVGLRPHTVYGPGRDQGLTSAPTVAMLAAAARRPYRIPFGGALRLQYAPDAAAAFVAASRSGATGATVHDLPGADSDIPSIVAAIEEAAPESAGTISHDGAALPFPARTDASSFAALAPGFRATPLAEGVAETIARFRTLLGGGLVAPP
jgi:nucleoside-diphosphate-sugar epimerase